MGIIHMRPNSRITTCPTNRRVTRKADETRFCLFRMTECCLSDSYREVTRSHRALQITCNHHTLLITCRSIRSLVHDAVNVTLHVYCKRYCCFLVVRVHIRCLSLRASQGTLKCRVPRFLSPYHRRCPVLSFEHSHLFICLCFRAQTFFNEVFTIPTFLSLAPRRRQRRAQPKACPAQAAEFFSFLAGQYHSGPAIAPSTPEYSSFNPHLSYSRPTRAYPTWTYTHSFDLNVNWIIFYAPYCRYCDAHRSSSS